MNTPAGEAEQLLIDPRDGTPLRREGDAFVGSSQRYALEDGVVRLLRDVDPALAKELEAQDNALEEYRDPALLMPRYERDMARLALIELFGGCPPTGTILDAGCGIGLLGRLYPELGLVGLDASMTLIREAKTGYRLRVEASAEALPFRDATFDVVVALNMLHHVINPELAVREFARVLKPGGTLVTVDPRKVGIIEFAKQALRGRDAAFAPTHKAFGVSEYESLVAQQGRFKIDRRQRVGLFTLLTMGGFDALRLSRRVPNPELFADVLRGIDQLAFRLPGVSRAGLNLAIRATKICRRGPRAGMIYGVAASMNEAPEPPPAVSDSAPSGAPPVLQNAGPDAAPLAPAAQPKSARLKRLLEWFWRGRAISAAAESGVVVPQRARELHRRAALTAELGRRALEPSRPLLHGAGDAVACELFRQSVFWSLASLAVTRGEPALARGGDLRALLGSANRSLLLQASPDPDALAELEAALSGSSFGDFAELPPEGQRDLAWKLRRFVDTLLGALDTTQAKLDALRFQRFIRVGTVVGLLFFIVPLSFLLADWSLQRRDLGAGKPWKASSQSVTVCPSPAQKCAGFQGYFFHTNEEDSPWLMIDLGSGKKQFSEVRVVNRTDCCPERALPLVIEVSKDKTSWKQVASRSDAFDTWKATFPDVKARYVRVRVTRRSFLHLASVRVLR